MKHRVTEGGKAEKEEEDGRKGKAALHSNKISQVLFQ